MFFALGVLVVLPWLLLNYGCLWPMGTTGALEAIVGSWLDPFCQIVVKLLLFYSLLILFLGWARCVCHNPNRTRNLVWAAVALCLVSALVGIFLSWMNESLKWASAVGGVLLAACWAMHPRVRLWQAVLSLVLWGGGLLLLAMICGDITIVPGSGFEFWLADISWCTGHVWGLLAGLGVLAVLGGYWCAGLAIARATAVPLRRLAGWSTRTLWVLVGLVYVLTLVLAVFAQVRMRSARHCLAVHFKRQMTLTAAEEHYYQGRRRDPEFWRLVEERLREMAETLSNTMDRNANQLMSRPFGVLPDELHAKWKGALLANSSAQALHEQLTGDIPAAERNYSAGMLMEISELGWLQSLARMEMWLLRFAVDDRDSAAALEAYSRMEKICVWLEDDGLLNAQLVACHLKTELQLEALAMLASSGVAPEKWLQEQSEKLTAAEEMWSDREKEVLYFEACFLLDALRVLGHGGRVFPGESTNVVCVDDLKWFLPTAWWRVAGENAEFIHRFERGSFADLSEPGELRYLGALQDKLMADGAAPEVAGCPTFNWALWEWSRSLRSAEKRLQRRLAGWRVARGLLAAELTKRRTGDYPETLEMPPEPFAEGNLQYFKGIVSRPVFVWYDDEPGESYWKNGWGIKVTEHAGVEVWSVGPDGKEDTEEKHDDVKYYLVP
ncbi:MAG: hypothetical protein J5654_07945 [Victivallales bacterium]|nr:hypothetical protein [Victivallales bacterium]